MDGTARSMARMSVPPVDLASCRAWFRRNRRRSRSWFDLLTPEGYEARPIALRHPVVFYEGHVAAFNVNTLVKLGCGRPGVDADLEVLFERGIDPDGDRGAQSEACPSWPSRSRVLEYAHAADGLVEAVLADDATVVRADHPV